MAIFQAPFGYNFSEDGQQCWAVFQRVRGSSPAVYECDTSDKTAVGKLKKLDDVTEVKVSSQPEEPVAYRADPVPVTDRKPGEPPKETE